MSVPPLTKDELIDDRALREVEQDEFGHADFVDELEGVIRNTPTPTTVSVYAPWGSGKTSLAFLLAARFRDDRSVRFLRFDAMKYAETPLRRHFVAKVAEELDIEDSKYRSGLYESTTRNELMLPEGSVGAFVRAFLFGLLGLGLLALFLAAIYAVVADGPTGREFRDAIGWLGPRIFAPAAVLGILGALATTKLTSEYRSEAPSSPEQFEQRFRDLVKDAIGEPSLPVGQRKVDDSKRRLCVFVDELDRCPAEQVVSTLDSIRTFFEIYGCVFIVAADQQALEEALSKAVEQETPANATDPYYSGGGAHLDKVFHPQLPLPPIKQQTLSQFALRLVRHRPGVWKRLREGGVLEDTLSVLIPTHVQSPRRVKALLNAFLLLYRTAWRRVDKKTLAGPMEGRSTEVARLACLRLEFPLFAQDLALDSRMPELVLAEVERRARDAQPFEEEGDDKVGEDQGNGSSAGLRPEVRKRVEQWASQELPVAGLLIQPAGRPAEAGDLNSQDVRAGETSPHRVQAVQKEHADQLLRYLRKTRRVAGPRTDLVHLESAAAGLELELEPSDADALERAAVDADKAAVAQLVADLEPEMQRDAFRLLIHVVRKSSVGLEGENAVAVLLLALSEAKGELLEIADSAAAAVAPHTYRLETDDLPGALTLSLQSSREEGLELRRQVRDHSESLASPELCELVIAAADRLLVDDSAWAGQAVVSLIQLDADRAIQALQRSARETALEILDAARAPLQAYLTSLDEADAESREVAHNTILRVLDSFVRVDRSLAQRFAAGLIRAGSEDFVQPIVARLELLKPIDDVHLASTLYLHASKQTPEDWARWLEAIPVDTIREMDDPRFFVEPIESAWRGYLEGSVDDESLRVGIDAMRPYANAGLLPVSKGVSATVQDLSATVPSDAQQRARVDQFEVAQDLLDLGVVEAADLSRSAFAFARESAVDPAVSPAVGEVVSLVESFVPDASREDLDSLFALADSGPWPVLSVTLGLLAGAALRDRFGAEIASPISGQRVNDLYAAAPEDFRQGWTVWMTEFAEDPEDVWLGVRSVAAEERLDPSTADSIRDRCRTWRTQQGEVHDRFLELVVRHAVTVRAQPEFLRACLLHEGDHDQIAAQLSGLAESVEEIEASERFLLVWEALSPDKEAVLRTLANNVLLPLARSDGTLDLMLRHASLAATLPKDRRQEFRRVVRRAAAGTGREDEVEAEFKAVGLVKRKGRIRRRDEDV